MSLVTSDRVKTSHAAKTSGASGLDFRDHAADWVQAVWTARISSGVGWWDTGRNCAAISTRQSFVITSAPGPRR